MRATVSVAPAAEPLLTADAKLHLRIDHDDEDDLIDGYIAAARQFFEDQTGLSLIHRTLLVYARWFPKASVIRLPYPPLSSVTSVTYTTGGGEQTLATSVYQVDNAARFGAIMLKDGQSWPSDLLLSPFVKITCVVGYGAAGTAVPADILGCLRLLVAHAYEHRTPVFVPERGGGDPRRIPLSAQEVIDYYAALVRRG